MKIWDAPEDIKSLVAEIKAAYHPHLVLAKLLVLISDAKHIVDNQLVTTTSAKCTKTEKLKTGNDFKIIINAEAWHLLTSNQRRIAIDEALCRCGVHYVPMTQKINKKDVIIKDEIGRTVFTTEIANDGNGEPKWKVNKPDINVYFALLQRHQTYSVGVENITNAMNGLPLKLPMAAAQPDADANLEQTE